ncbi:hypothetical protein Sango_2118500 [Sesamum angolense]|uniref:Retrotransposon gag domain-containing protein n=1 Tax=Sesamum angolense TaxID=2727404 RepID=A0AAE1WC34_9LAMI|nr:hypothetical protein Sango_2118500 [Sesamum angolense]
MTSRDLNQQPLCIEYPTLEVDRELKSGPIHLLRTFRGLAGEDPHKHLKEFHVVCSGMRPQGVTEKQVKLRAFPFSLGDKAKDWLYLPSGSIHSSPTPSPAWDEPKTTAGVVCMKRRMLVSGQTKARGLTPTVFSASKRSGNDAVGQRPEHARARADRGAQRVLRGLPHAAAP